MGDGAHGTLWRLSRLVGGVALMQGGLGHQVLGQLLILDASDLEVAGATAAMAAAARTRSALAEAAVRTVAPALAAHGLARREEQRLLRLQQRTGERERECARREQGLLVDSAALEQRRAALDARAAPPADLAGLAARIAALEQENAILRARLGQPSGEPPASGPGDAPAPRAAKAPARRKRPRGKP